MVDFVGLDPGPRYDQYGAAAPNANADADTRSDFGRGPGFAAGAAATAAAGLHALPRAARALSEALFAQDESDARRVGEQAVQLARHRRDWPGAADALYQLVVNCERAADYVAAMQYSQQGVGVTRAHHLPHEWRFTQCMGLVAVDTKDVASGLKFMRKPYRQQAAVKEVSPRERGGLLLNLANTFRCGDGCQPPGPRPCCLTWPTRFWCCSATTRCCTTRRGCCPTCSGQRMRGLGYVYQYRGEVYAMMRPQSRATLAAAALNMNRALRLMQRHGFRPQVASSALSLARVYRLAIQPAAAQRSAWPSSRSRRLGS